MLMSATLSCKSAEKASNQEVSCHINRPYIFNEHTDIFSLSEDTERRMIVHNLNFCDNCTDFVKGYDDYCDEMEELREELR